MTKEELKKRIAEINDKIRSAKTDSKEISQNLNGLVAEMNDLKQIIQKKTTIK
jgi:chromosome segregation ATPase